ncbi:MAG: methionyl-tRNA formyltransferase [Nitrospirota bacterium]
MKIVFFGTPEIAVPILETLAQIPDFEVISVVTQPDRPIGRKGAITPPPIKVSATNLGIKILQPQNKIELEELLKDLQADFFIVVAYGMIIPQHILAIPKYGSINVHYSLLPRYRGASPIQESLLRGDKATGVTLIKMDKKLDHGPVFLMKRIEIEDDDNLLTLSAKLTNLSSQILPLALEDIAQGNLNPIEQPHEQATFCQKIKKSDGIIDWNLSALQIRNMIRAYTPWPSVFTEIGGKKLKILKADVYESDENFPPGQFKIEDKILKISTSKDYLVPKKVQLEGKKEMDIETFLNGYGSLIKSSN